MASQQEGTHSENGAFWFRALRALRSALDALVQSSLSQVPKEFYTLIEDAPQRTANVKGEDEGENWREEGDNS